VARELKAPPAAWALVREAAGALAIPQLAWSWTSLQAEPAGDGSRIVVLPGFGADDSSTWALRAFLRSRGYDVRGWGLGANRAGVPDAIERVGQAALAAAREIGAPLTLLGWSLGGYIAREVARDHPQAVRQVITLGSPVIGGPKYTTVARLAPLQGWDLEDIEREVARRKQVPLRVPVTAIYSRRDGIVAWEACIDPEAGGPIDHVEVTASHLGLGFDPAVYRIVARRLAGLSVTSGTATASTPTA
jgi:pimeloyl-ACP methyl ester carboxylesterase